MTTDMLIEGEQQNTKKASSSFIFEKKIIWQIIYC